MGVAVVSAPRPIVDDTTVRLLGRIAYSLSGYIDGRMQEAQNKVLGLARGEHARPARGQEVGVGAQARSTMRPGRAGRRRSRPMTSSPATNRNES